MNRVDATTKPTPQDRAWRAVTLVFFAIILDGFDSQALGFALPSLIAEWHLPKTAFAPVLSVSLVGMTLGSAIAGALGDRLGRKAVLVGCVALFGAMTAATAMAMSIEQLGILRFIAAAGLGGAMPNAAALIGEVTPARYRSLAISSIAVCVPLGGVFGGLAASGLLPTIGWRGLFLIAGLIPLAYAVVLHWTLPEPKLAPPAAQTGEGARQGSVLQLFRPPYILHTCLLSAAFFCCLLSVYACFNWLPTLIASTGGSIATASLGLTLFNLGGVVAAIGGGWATGRFGSRWPLAGMFVAAIALSFALPMTFDQPALMLLVLGLLGAAIAGAQSVLTALAAQSFPPSQRAAGIGVPIGFGRIGGIASAFLGAAALAGGPASFATMLGVAALAGLVVVLCIRQHLPPIRV